MERSTVLIADDHTLVAEGLQRIVEREFCCVGIVSNGEAALNAAEELSPDIILLDISMPTLNGIEVAQRLLQSSRTKVFFVSMTNNPEYVKEALAIGASGFLSKECAGTQLLQGIREILSGGTYVSTELSRQIGRGSSLAPDSQPVTPRQREVLELVVRGLPAKTIAHQLSISPKTVEFHKTTMMRALSLRNTAELIRFAIEHQLVEPSRSAGAGY